jgi:Skp family chaperone for outer membrane proteins
METTETEASVETLEVMPGADVMEVGEPLDMNFGLGVEEELVLESAEEAEELVPESAELEAELAEPEPEPQAKMPMVPKARLDEVLAKQKALQKQLDDIRAKNEPAADAPEEFDFNSKELEYQQLVLDGEADKATMLRQDIRKAERQQIAYEMRQEMNQSVSQNQQQVALATAAAEMEATYPIFDRNSETFDSDRTQEVVELRDAFITQGFEPVDALAKAVNFVVKSNDIAAVGESAPSLSGKANSVADIDKKRREISKKLKAAETQPPELPGESSSSRGESYIDINKLSQAEFDALPEATIQRLRGDFF